jgi:hypothetical protein
MHVYSTSCVVGGAIFLPMLLLKLSF